MSEFTEWYGDFGVTFRIKRKILEKKSQYQKIELYETESSGKMLVLDGAIQFVEKWERTYHEVLVHPAILAHPNPKRVLIIGGGDGGALREVLRHPVEKAVMVEIDDEVVKTVREHVPIDNGAFEDPRAELIIGDGIKYIENTENEFDVIIIDSTDPVGPAVSLFSEEFYSSCKRALRENGVVITQAGGSYFHVDEFLNAYRNMKKAFGRAYAFGFTVIGYAPPWNFVVGLKGGVDFEKIRVEGAPDTEYYDPKRHLSMLYLPRFLREKIEM
jgi:spermidine synthase